MEIAESLHRHTPLPLYYQLQQILRQDIGSGKFKPGESLPSELELARTFRVSRYTMRRAIGDLTREGLLYRHQGRGTFVARPAVQQSLAGFYSFAREMRDMGLAHRSEVLERTSVQAGQEIAGKLHLSTEEKVIRIVRLRFMLDEPVILETSLVSFRLCPDLMSEDLTHASLYDVLEARGGVVVTGATETIRPVILNKAEAHLLHVETGSAALHVERLAHAGSQTVEWRQSLLRGDRYLYSVELPRVQAPERST